MAANKNIRFGPVAVSNSVGNLINCNITSLAGPIGYTQTQPYLILRHLRVVNKTGSAATLSMYIGATGGSAAGTEFLGNGLSVPANSYIEWYGMLRLDAADFLTAIASAATTLTFEAEGEIGIS